MHAPENIDLAEVISYAESVGPESRIYIGCDSEKLKIDGEWYADYCVAVVVHINNCNGGKVFGAITRERVYDKNPKRPSLRLMREVQLIADLYLQLAPEVLNDIEIHLDINPNEIHGSSCVISEATGYIRGMCQVEPKVKPEGWAASYTADLLKRIMNYKLGEPAVFS